MSIIKQIALDSGFKLKQQPNGEMDLNPYVYDFANALLQSARDYAASKVDPDDLAQDYDLAMGEFAKKIKESI